MPARGNRSSSGAWCRCAAAEGTSASWHALRGAGRGAATAGVSKRPHGPGQAFADEAVPRGVHVSGAPSEVLLDLGEGAIDVVGTDCLVFGSDFPHSEGLPDPVQYAKTLEGLDDATVQNLMRDNLARFLRLDA